MSIAYALLSGVLPALLWLWFWLREDNLHPEPRSLLSISFISGGIVVIFAILAEGFIAEVVSNTQYRYIAWAAVEEIFKFLAVLFIASKLKGVDEPIDAMIYCITVALGFAGLENTLFVLSPLLQGDIAVSIVTGNMRFIGATLVHTVSTALIGFMIGLSFYRSYFTKFLLTTIGVILAIVLHASFNLSIIDGTVTNTLKVFGWVWLSVIVLMILFEEIKVVKPKSVKG